MNLDISHRETKIANKVLDQLELDPLEPGENNTLLYSDDIFIRRVSVAVEHTTQSGAVLTLNEPVFQVVTTFWSESPPKMHENVAYTSHTLLGALKMAMICEIETMHANAVDAVTAQMASPHN